MTSPPERRQAERLLEPIRTQVAELRRPRANPRADRRELQQRRREIAGCNASSRGSSANSPAAATSPPK
jgi:hypothetical protein